MRICIVAPHASTAFGGEAILPLHYFQKLRARGIEVWLVVHARTRDEIKQVLGEDIKRVHFVEDTPVDVFLWRCGKFFPRAIQQSTFGLLLKLHTQYRQKKVIRSLIDHQQINLVHEPTPVSPKSPSMMYGFGVPVVIGPMNGGMTYPEPFTFLQGRFEARFVKAARTLAILSNLLIPGKNRAHTLLVANERTKNALPVDTSKKNIVELVENGVDLSVFGADAGNSSQPDQGIKLIFIGRLVDWKGVNYLLDVLSSLKGRPFSLRILGDGDKRRELEEQTRQLGLEDRVVFHGFLSQIECAEYLKDSHVLVLPSLCECGGAVVLEAMAMKKAVVATNWGGPADYINEECGILVDPAHSIDQFKSGLKNAIEKLIGDPQLTQKMGEAGRQRVMEEFNWVTKIDRIIDVYQNVISGATGAEKADRDLPSRLHEKWGKKARHG